jgi:hypothetical protein
MEITEAPIRRLSHWKPRSVLLKILSHSIMLLLDVVKSVVTVLSELT